MITNAVPYPPMSGGAVRAYNLFSRIARRHEVWLAAHLRVDDDRAGVDHLRGMCAGVIVGALPRGRSLDRAAALVGHALAGRPPELAFYNSRELADGIGALARGEPFDLVLIEESHMAHYLEAIPAAGRRGSVLTFYDVVFERFARYARVERRPLARGRAWLHSAAMRRWEPRVARWFDRCIAVSDEDRALLTAASPGLRVDVVPNGVDTQALDPLPWDEAGPAVLFVGSMRYPPCEDAALYLVAEILPRLRARIPEVQAWIVGADPPPRVRRLAGDGVHVTGRVEDLRPYYSRCAASVVPLRIGGGTRIKILEAMALGRPVVSTTVGCEGLRATDGRHLVVADDPDRFAEATARVLSDRALGQQLAANARGLVRSVYDWEPIAREYLRICEGVLDGVGRGQR